MPRGGSRKGAGRKPGAITKRTREAADRSVTEGLSPLDVMLRTMRDHAAADRWDEATKVAALAAPFVHPKLAAAKVEAEVRVDLLDLILDSYQERPPLGAETGSRH